MSAFNVIQGSFSDSKYNPEIIYSKLDESNPSCFQKKVDFHLYHLLYTKHPSWLAFRGEQEHSNNVLLWAMQSRFHADFEMNGSWESRTDAISGTQSSRQCSEYYREDRGVSPCHGAGRTAGGAAG